MKLTDRTVLITGGTSGIGQELARQLLRGGNTVIVTGRDQKKLDATSRALPGVHVILSDVSDPAAVTGLYETVTTRVSRARHPRQQRRHHAQSWI